jgi:hypothetical protein
VPDVLRLHTLPEIRNAIRALRSETDDISESISGIVGAAGANTQVQYNRLGLLGADAGLTWNTATLYMGGYFSMPEIAAPAGNPAANTGWTYLMDAGGVSTLYYEDDGGAVHDLVTHDAGTLEHDGVNSNGGAFGFNTTGQVTFNQNVGLSAGYFELPEIAAPAGNPGANLGWLYLLDVGGVSNPQYEDDGGTVHNLLGLTVGAPITAGGGVNRVLYEGAGNVITQDANFQWDGTNLLASGNASSISAALYYDINGTRYISADGTNCFLIGNGNNNSGVRCLCMGDRTLGDGGAGSTGDDNTAFGYDALRLNTSGYRNVSIGSYTLDANTTGYQNLAIGLAALTANVDGYNNIAIGTSALSTNTGGGGTSGSLNMAVGTSALQSCSTGSYNVAVGVEALVSLTTGISCFGLGYRAGYRVQTGNALAIGTRSLYTATAGGYNTAVGNNALYTVTGERNCAVGYDTMRLATTAIYNTATGTGCLYNLTTGDYNTGVGAYAGQLQQTGSNNTYLGYFAGRGGVAVMSASGGVYLGYCAGYYEQASNTLFIDNATRASEADGRVKALVYGIFNAATTSQQIRFNANTEVFNEGASYLDIVADTDNDAADTDALLRFGIDGITGAWTQVGKLGYDQGLDRLVLGYANDNDIAIDTNGRVGFNETSPASAIDIDDDAGGADMGYITMEELSGDAAAPAANHCVIFTRDNGGKTELCARFPTGAIQQLAIEP